VECHIRWIKKEFRMGAVVEGTVLYSKALGCLLGGLIGDAIGTPTEGKHYRDIEAQYGWVDDFDCDGTDDTVMKTLLAEALIRTEGYATLDDWAQAWLDSWDAIFGPKMDKFFVSVVHTAQKIRRHSVPRMAALGNMPSSSSAMCISPVGIVNAGSPAQAAQQAYNLASLIHVHDVGYCQDGAAAMAAAVAEAMRVDATVPSVLGAAQDAIIPRSGREMRERIAAALELARQADGYQSFRHAIYARSETLLCEITCDSRETVPLALALFFLAEGDVERSVVYAANLGRDADTIASMCGAVAGAMGGVGAIRADWVDKAQVVAAVNQADLAARLARAALVKHEREMEARRRFEQLLSTCEGVEHTEGA
jgi:ADP-ribosylglycohydrolase